MMQKFWNKLGWILFWFCLPALFVYLRRGDRPRVLVTHGTKVLVVKSWLGDGRWQLPGGGAHKNETLKAAALRELFEETGLTLAPEVVISKGKRTQDSDLLRFSYSLFVATVRSSTVPSHKTAEITAVQWIDQKNLHPHNAQQHVLDSLK